MAAEIHPRRFVTVLLILPSLLAALAGGAAPKGAPLTEASRVTLTGIGPVRVGMTVRQASRALGRRLVAEGEAGSACYYVAPRGGPKDLAFMVLNGRIARVDVGQGSRIRTSSGAEIGDTEARIKALYPGQIRVSKHAYVDGHYLTFVPRDRRSRNYRVVFETDGKKVTSFRAGRLPAVEYIEGCS